MSEKEKNEKLKVLELTIGKLEKSYGKGILMKLGDKVDGDVASIPTGSVSLDIALGVGVTQEEELSRFMDPNHLVKQH